MNNYQSVKTGENTYKFIAKKQNFFIGKCCLIAGGLFALIFAIAFVISKFVFLKNDINFNYIIMIGTISLIAAFIFSIIMSFKGISASFWLIITTITIYSFAFIMMFSSYFSLLGNSIMFFALAFTSIAIIGIGIISFIIPAKTAYSILKISMISFGAYIMISLVGSLVLWFTYSSTTIQIWQIVVTALIGFVIICSTIFSFYKLKQTSEFINISDIDSTTYNKLLLLQAFNILSSIIMLFMWILRILGIANRS